MHNGFKKLALGITGVAMLSGTSLALGPTISQPPTLIITDRTKASVILQGGAEFDDLTVNGTDSETFNNYIFTEAFSLSDLVTVPAGATLADVEWNFAELDPSDDSILAAGQTISISDGTVSSTGVSSAPTFASLGTPFFDTVLDADPLSFENVVRTTNTTGTIGNFDDLARIRLYAATTTDATETVATATFDIITTNDTGISVGDAFSVPSSVFIPVEGFDDLGGLLNQFALNLGPVFQTAPIGLSAANDVSPDSVPSVASLVTDVGTDSTTRSFLPPNTPTLRLFTNTDTTDQTVTNAFGPGNGNLTNYGPELIGYGSFIEAHPTLASTATVEANKLYMVRWNLTSPNTPASATRLPLAQLLVGASDGGGIGRTSLEFGNNSFNNLVSPTVGEAFDIRQYFYAHGAGDLGFFINLFDTATVNTPEFTNADGHQGHDITINRVDVFEVNTAGLTGESVLFNQGAASVTLAAGQTIAPTSTGQELFDLDIWAGRDQLSFIAAAHGASANRNSSLTPDNPISGTGTVVTPTNATASRLSFTHGTGNGPTFIQWDTFNSLTTITGDPDPVRANPREVLELTEGDLVFMDYYLSATGSNATLPFTRVGVQSDNIPVGGLPTVASVSGLVGFMQMEPRPGGIARTGNPIDPALPVGTQAIPAVPFDSTGSRLLRFVFEVQLTSTPGIDRSAPNYAARPTFQSYVIPGGALESGAQGTVNLDRVVVTKYDPVTGADIAMPASLTDID